MRKNNSPSKQQKQSAGRQPPPERLNALQNPRSWAPENGTKRAPAQNRLLNVSEKCEDLMKLQYFFGKFSGDRQPDQKNPPVLPRLPTYLGWFDIGFFRISVCQMKKSSFQAGSAASRSRRSLNVMPLTRISHRSVDGDESSLTWYNHGLSCTDP
jgi:hypothetical protein